MDALRRTIGTLFIPSGFHRSLLLSTYEDVFAAEEGEIEGTFLRSQNSIGMI